jgi:hypothetical protein
VDGERLEELAGRLDQVAESLSDIAMDVLREALSSVRRGVGDDESGDVVASAKQTEKLINRARAAAEKGARLARQAATGRAAAVDGDSDGDGDP